MFHSNNLFEGKPVEDSSLFKRWVESKRLADELHTWSWQEYQESCRLSDKMYKWRYND